jgi:hypothetical protein
MQNLTTPKAILIGLSFMAVAIASLPFTDNVVPAANAQNEIMKVQICDDDDICLKILPHDTFPTLPVSNWN